MEAKLERLESALQSEIKAAKLDYESNSIKQFALSRDPRIYRYINSLTDPSQFPDIMHFGATEAVSDRDKATLFTNYFFSVFSTRSTELPSPNDLPLPASSLSNIDISLSDIYNALISLDARKTQGPDGISPLVLKFCAAALCEPIYHLFSVSLRILKLPSELCVHRITPVF